MVHIGVKNLSKSFNLDCKPHGTLPLGRRKHTAIDNVSFEIREGECVGIVGKNGSGKTTLLKLLAGILEPDGGEIETEGRILPLIELQTGMAEELTGRENIFNKGIIHGLTREEIQTKLSHIIEFSGLKEFIDVKLKKYSNGMKMRLAFSVVMEIPHDIILLDEIAGVGDEEFSKKSYAKLMELRLQGNTFVVVSHQMGGFIKDCNRVIFLDEGKIVADGSPEETIQLYLQHMIKHHLAGIKEETKQKLEELERVRNSKSDVKKVVGRLFRWRRDNRSREPTYEEIRDELKPRVREYQRLVHKRCEYLTEELARLQKLLYEQKEYNKGSALDFEAEEKYRSDSSKIEEELRQMLDTQEFLLDVKMRLGYKSDSTQFDHDTIRGAVRSLRESESPGDVKSDTNALKERFLLKVLEQELAENPPIKKALLTIRDYASTCQEILKSESDTKARTEILERFLNLIEGWFKESAQKELWVVERLLDETSSVCKTDVLLVTEYPFLLRYTSMAKHAIITVAPQPAIRKKIDTLGHLLRETIHLAERQLISMSLNQDKISPSESKEQARLLEAKQQLLQGLSELYISFRAKPIHAGKGWGFGDAEITGLSLHSRDGEERQVFKTGEPMRVVIRYMLHRQLAKGVLVGLTIHHENGLPLFAPNTIITEKDRLKPGVENTVQFVLKSLPLTCGSYPLSVAIYDPLLTVPYDHHHQAFEFRVIGEEELGNQGILDLEHTWETAMAENRRVQ